MVACEQNLNLGESREFTPEPHTKGDVKVRGIAPRSLVVFFALHNCRTCSRARGTEFG